MLKSYSVIQSVNPYFGLSKPTLSFLILLLLASCNGGDNDGDPPFGDPSPSISCPDGFIPVPHNTEVGTTSDFCVMKYEAKNNGSGVAVSQAEGNPYPNLSMTESQTKCNDLNTLNGVTNKFDLISNSEWMTIARNAEGVSSNWSTGSVGYGVMARGWAAKSNSGYGDSWSNTDVAPSTNSNCIYNTGSNTCGSSGDHLYRRTLTLSNDEEIWDLSGNVWEWVDWSHTTAGLDFGPTTCSASRVEFPVAASYPCLSGLANQVFPATSNGSSVEGFGSFTGGSGGFAARGGDWGYMFYPGAFSLVLNFSAVNPQPSIGFRCVYRP